nr:MAG TPA_asm: hypothetical protein [Caudoviricetes sp.]
MLQNIGELFFCQRHNFGNQPIPHIFRRKRRRSRTQQFFQFPAFFLLVYTICNRKSTTRFQYVILYRLGSQSQLCSVGPPAACNRQRGLIADSHETSSLPAMAAS